MAQPNTESTIDVSKLAADQLAGVLAGARATTEGVALSSWECRKYANTLSGKTIVITGGGSGIGRDLAKIAAGKGARVAIGDVNLKGAEAVIADIKKAGGQAFAHRCNVTEWESQRDFFQAVEDKYGFIDIVAPLAGITERFNPGFEDDVFDSNGKLAKPTTTTLDINLIGVVYSVKLAYYYLRKHPQRKGKALALMGSMASFHPIPSGPMYTTSKHAILGLMKSAFFELHAHGIRVACCCPWFIETGIIEPLTRLALVGLPMAKIEDATSALIAAVSHPDQDGVTLVVDPKGVLSVPFEGRTLGEDSIYAEFGRRATQSLTVRAVVTDLYKVARAYAGRHGKIFWPVALLSLLFIRRRRAQAKVV